MSESASWSEYSARQITGAGLRRSVPRQRVIDLLADRNCAVTALEIDAELDGVGRATVYRAIEQLEDLGLVHRVDLGGASLGYEIAIHDIRRKGFKLETHEVTLHGRCADCR